MRHYHLPKWLADFAGLPPRLMTAVCISQIAQGINFTVPMSIAVFMVRKFTPDASEETIAQRTGFLASSFMLSTFLMSLAWGMISDRVGRKKVIMVGQFASAISMLFIGSVGNYGNAVTVRFIAGLFNGVIGAVKCMMGETMTIQQQTSAFAYFSTSWGLGTVLGPMLAGLTSDPCSRHHCGPNNLFALRPYALPCFLSAVITLGSLTFVVYHVQETHPKIRTREGLGVYREPPVNWPRWIRVILGLIDGHPAGSESDSAPVLGGGFVSSNGDPAAAAAAAERAREDSAAARKKRDVEMGTLGPAVPVAPVRGKHVKDPEAAAKLRGRAGLRRDPAGEDGADLVSGTDGGEGPAGSGLPPRAPPGGPRGALQADPLMGLDGDALPMSDAPHASPSAAAEGPKGKIRSALEAVGRGENDEALVLARAAPIARTMGPIGQGLGAGMLSGRGEELVKELAAKVKTAFGPKPTMSTPGRPLALSYRSDSSRSQPKLPDGDDDDDDDGKATFSRSRSQAAVGSMEPPPEMVPLASSSAFEAPAAAEAAPRERSGALDRGASGRMANVLSDDGSRAHGPLADVELARGEVDRGPSRKQSQRPNVNAGNGGGMIADPPRPGDLENGAGGPATAGRAAVEGYGEARDLAAAAKLPAISSDVLYPKAPPQKVWWEDRQVVATLVGYSLISLSFNMADELLPIFASTPTNEGGLGFTTRQLALPLSMGGLTLMVYAMFGFPLACRHFGVVRTCQFGCLGLGVLGLLVPFSSVFNSNPVAAQITLIFAVVLKSISNNNAFASCIILVNAAAMNFDPGMLGVINGAGQTAAAGMRAIGPTLGGYLWSVTLDWGPGHQYYCFLFILKFCLAAFYTYTEVKVGGAQKAKGTTK